MESIRTMVQLLSKNRNKALRQIGGIIVFYWFLGGDDHCKGPKEQRRGEVSSHREAPTTFLGEEIVWDPGVVPKRAVRAGFFAQLPEAGGTGHRRRRCPRVHINLTSFVQRGYQRAEQRQGWYMYYWVGRPLVPKVL